MLPSPNLLAKPGHKEGSKCCNSSSCGSALIDEETKKNQFGFISCVFPFCLLGNDDTFPSLGFTLFLFIFPLLFTLLTEYPFLLTTQPPLHPSFPFLRILLPVLPILSIISLLLLTVVCCRDPGILAPLTPYKRNRLCPDPKPSKHHLIVPHTNKPYTTKWCTSCKIWRPLRTVHCHSCGVCIRRFDHHCPWISKCIGMRNHLFFIIWLFSATLVNVVFFLYHVLLIQIFQGPSFSLDDVATFVASHPSPYVFMLYQLPFGLFTLYLFCFHSWLALTDQTTNERYKPEYKDARPFAASLCENVGNFVRLSCQPSALFSRDISADLTGADVEITRRQLRDKGVYHPLGMPVEYLTAIQNGGASWESAAAVKSHNSYQPLQSVAYMTGNDMYMDNTTVASVSHTHWSPFVPTPFASENLYYAYYPSQTVMQPNVYYPTQHSQVHYSFPTSLSQ